MGKKKFIDKKTATTFKIVNQPGKDGHGVSNEICFQKVEKRDEELQQKSEVIEKQLNKGLYDPTIKPRLPEIDHASEALDLVKGRDDLWINQIKRQKALQALKEKQEQYPDIIMKHYDENGFPIDGYDYYQHVAKDEPQGEVICSFVVPEEERQKVVIDIDFKRDELTEEQKEVFDLLMNEEEEENIEAEELEDDIVSKIMQESKQAQNVQPEKVEQPKKQVRFQQDEDEQDDEEDFEDVDDEEEEMEIPMNKEQLKQQEKKQQQQNQQKQQQQKQTKKESESEGSESDLEIDSDMEREFEREMKAYDEDDDEEENLPKVEDLQLNKVIEDHLQTMGQKQKKKQKKEPKEETQEQKEQRLEHLKNTDYNEYLRQKFPNADFSQFHLKKEIPPLTPEEDIALQNYLNRESTDEECPEMEPAEKEYETIITKSLHNTTMSKMNPEQLNIIKYKQKANQLTREELIKAKQQEKEQIKKLKEEKEKIKDEICETLKQVVLKKDETPEEKKKRKELVKQLKQAQKEKKKQFKEQLQTVAKKVQKQKLANIQSNQHEGISIKKL